MGYPEGQVETSEGLYEWVMENADTIAVRGNPLLINQVEYEGIVSLHRDKAENQFVMAWGDVYLVRVGDVHTGPTRAAMVKFRDRVVGIAREVDTDDLRAQTEIAVLQEELSECASAILRLREELEENEDRIEEIETELARLE